MESVDKTNLADKSREKDSIDSINIADEAREKLPPKSVTEKGTFLQKSGVYLFYSVLILTALILLGLFLYLLCITPSFIVSPATAIDANTSQVLIQERQTVFGNFTAGVEKTIIAFCFPLLTGILGYLFGTREASNS